MGSAIQKISRIFSRLKCFLRHYSLGKYKVILISLLLFLLFLLYQVKDEHGVSGSFESAKKIFLWPAEISKTLLQRLNASQLMEHLPLFRDVYRQEEWSEISREDSVTPEMVPSTVHYVWCGEKRVFGFEHYLPILSTLRLLHPLKVIFHYSHLPVPDRLWYHAWFWELKQSFASLELRSLAPHHKNGCHPEQLSATVLDLLCRNGGLYIAPNVILTRFPKDFSQQPFWFSKTEDNLPGLVFAQRSFNNEKKLEYLHRLQSRERNCSTVRVYNQVGALNSPPCLPLTNQLRPKDIMAAGTPLGELARWLYYGQRKVLEAKQSPLSSIPRIAHLTWLLPGGSSKRPFRFFHFLSVLSALHVAGLRHVYVHGDVRPSGEWWERLRGENVTFVPIDSIRQVFQQSVNVPAPIGVTLSAHILRAYGGVYMDGDVFWVNPIPDDLLRYPTVACPDWPSRGEWPAAFNTGVLMSQSDSPWLRHFLATMRRYLDWSWYYNGILMPYRVYEAHPESLYIDYHLQVICFKGNCHPTWQEGYQQDIIHHGPPPHPFDWCEAGPIISPPPNPLHPCPPPAKFRKERTSLQKWVISF